MYFLIYFTVLLRQLRRLYISGFIFLSTATVNPPYNDMGFAARRIVIKGVLLYLILVYKMHPKSKLGNDIISTPVKP